MGMKFCTSLKSEFENQLFQFIEEFLSQISLVISQGCFIPEEAF